MKYLTFLYFSVLSIGLLAQDNVVEIENYPDIRNDQYIDEYIPGRTSQLSCQGDSFVKKKNETKQVHTFQPGKSHGFWRDMIWGSSILVLGTISFSAYRFYQNKTIESKVFNEEIS